MFDIINSSKIAREVQSLMDGAKLSNKTRTSNQLIIEDKDKNRFFVKIIVENENWFLADREDRLRNIKREIAKMEKGIKEDI